jgi:hypothetical protein
LPVTLAGINTLWASWHIGHMWSFAQLATVWDSEQTAEYQNKLQIMHQIGKVV